MPVEHAIWTVGQQPKALQKTVLPSEQLLEEMIVSTPSLLSSDWMLIGQQETTPFGGRIDLLAIAPDASLVLIELKRSRTPREIVAQALDYASWVESLDAEAIVEIYERFSKGRSLATDFQGRFGAELDEDSLNDSHQILLVAAELDHATERIIGYLNARDIAINVLFFRVFQHGDEQLISRAWLIDPVESQANVNATKKSSREREPWNGEYYVSYGPTATPSWHEARKWGFISAAGGPWFTNTLEMLEPGDRVWVNVPKKGYVGVGRVEEPVATFDEFEVTNDKGERVAIGEVLERPQEWVPRDGDQEKISKFVRVQWLDGVAEEDAVKEVGFFGNQNSVCRPQTPKWRKTVDRLKTHFRKWDAG